MCIISVCCMLQRLYENCHRCFHSMASLLQYPLPSYKATPSAMKGSSLTKGVSYIEGENLVVFFFSVHLKCGLWPDKRPEGWLYEKETTGVKI